MKDLFRAHVEERTRRARNALEATDFDGLVLHSGTPMRYFADDNDAPFRRNPHFASWAPAEGPGHLIVVTRDTAARLIRHAPEDFWYEQAPLGDPFWAEPMQVEERADADAVFDGLPDGRLAFVGDAGDRAAARGFPRDAIQPEELVKRLDWDRAVKTPYEIECTRVAAEAAARGHRAGRAAFEQGASELAIHHAYVAAVPCIDAELPYESIVALDEKGATLHYTGKRRDVSGQVLLLDSGATHLGYASDITRTWIQGDVDPRFVRIREGMDEIELALCARLRPGARYLDLHLDAHRLIGALLHEVGVLRVNGDEAFERGLTRPFFPHGLGHFLGIQTHDVSGHQTAPEGGTTPPPDDHPFLRTTRTMEEGHVLTIEPGLYFIELLLRPFREGADRDAFDWDAIDKLSPYGGVRIEDDVVVTAGEPDNLTRAFLPE